jgi:hypothetical protein
VIQCHFTNAPAPQFSMQPVLAERHTSGMRHMISAMAARAQQGGSAR